MFDRQQSIRRAEAVSLSSTDYTAPTNSPTRAIYVGTGGNLVVRLADNPTVSVTYKVYSGSRHQLQAAKIMKTGTTAADIVAEF